MSQAENNFTTDQLQVYARADPNMGDLVQRPNRSGVRSTKTCNISKTVQDRTKVTMAD